MSLSQNKPAIFAIVGIIVVLLLLAGTYWYVQNKQTQQANTKGVINSDNLNKINSVGNPTNAANSVAK